MKALALKALGFNPEVKPIKWPTRREWLFAPIYVPAMTALLTAAFVIAYYAALWPIGFAVAVIRLFIQHGCPTCT